MTDSIVLAARELDDGLSAVVDAIWPNGSTHQLIGVFRSLSLADEWISHGSERWRASVTRSEKK
jgi:hypothetical protein